jgi:hypothetical protein
MLLTQQVSLPGEVTLPGGLKGGLYILEITTPDRLYRCRLIME